MTITLTASVGSNSKAFYQILSLYVPGGTTIADVTYGNGVFWTYVDTDFYRILKSDILTGTDFSRLPYPDMAVDALVLDPPYMHGGATVKESINKCYKNKNTSHESVVRLYTKGVIEAARVLKPKGILIVKCQDEIESGKQRMTHDELITIITILGFEIIDMFVVVQSTTPTMREDYQLHARKNHSYFLVFRFRR